MVSPMIQSWQRHFQTGSTKAVNLTRQNGVKSDQDWPPNTKNGLRVEAGPSGR